MIVVPLIVGGFFEVLGIFAAVVLFRKGLALHRSVKALKGAPMVPMSQSFLAAAGASSPAPAPTVSPYAAPAPADLEGK